MTAGQRASARGEIPSLNGIRAVSVALVFCSHDGLGNLVPGGLGVTIFFVLSGYLITTLMRTEFEKYGTLSFRAFYLRRFLRLTPPVLVVTALAVVLSLTINLGGQPFSSLGLASVLFYFSNYFVITHGPVGQPPGQGVTWSLAVEEHYYFLYPPLALLLLHLNRKWVSVTILASLCLGVLAWRCWLVLHGATEQHINMGTDTRVDAILIGCILAIACNPWLEPAVSRSRARDLAIAAICFVALIGTLAFRNELFRETFRYTLQGVSIAGLMYVAVARANLAPFKWLNTPVLDYLGRVSYTIYLVHYVILTWAEEHLAAWGRLGMGVVTFAITLLIAELMRRLIEDPLARVRRRMHDAAAAPHGPVLNAPSAGSAVSNGS